MSCSGHWSAPHRASVHNYYGRARENNANLLFLGAVSSDPTKLITSAQILNTRADDGDAIGIDDLTIGLSLSAVPEPATIIYLASAGAVFLAASYIRRRTTWSPSVLIA